MKRVLSIFMSLIIIFIMAAPQTADAATIKLNKSKAKILVGKSVTLKLTGTKKVPKWISSNKKIATVSTKGIVKGVKKGTANITAAINGKKYTCKVTVNEKTVDVIYRALIFDDTTIEEYTEKYQKDNPDYIDVKVYDKDHIAVTMNNSDRLTMLDTLNKDFDKNINILISDHPDIFTDIQSDKLLKDVKLYANKEKYENSYDGLGTVIAVTTVSDIVQALNLIDPKDRTCSISVIDNKTGTALDSY